MASSCRLVASASHTFRQRGNIDSPSGAQTEAIAMVGKFPEKYRRFHTGNACGVIDYTPTVFLTGAGAQHILIGNPKPGDAAIVPEVMQSRAQKQHSRCSDGEKDLMRNGRGIGACQYQRLSKGEGGRLKVAVAEAACIGQ